MSIQLPHPPTFQQAERTLTRWTRDARVRSALMALYAAQRRAFERQYPAAALTVPGEYPAATETTRAMPVSQLKAFMFTAAYNAAPRGEPSGFSQRDHHDLLALVTRAEQASRNVPAAQGTRAAAAGRMTLPDAALRAIDAGALVAINDSGGKDSAAQGIVLSAVVPPEQRLFIHASLGESEWPGALEQARTHAQTLGGTFTVVRARRTFLQMVVRRFQERPEVPCWPSPAHRQCTSDLKTNVINSAVIAHARAGGYTRVVSALGLRAEESRRRAQKATCAVHPKLDLKGRLLKSGEVRGRREWLTLLPIHAMNTEEVFGTIADAGMAPHPAYGLGNERVSCVLCIMAARCDLANGARHHPALYQRYAAVEYLTGWAMSSSRKTLPELTGVPLNVAWAEQFRGRLDELTQPQT